MKKQSKRQATNLRPSKAKSKPDKLVWILGVMAVLTLLSVIVLVGIGAFKATSSDQNQALKLTSCPAANKQHPGHCISSNVATLQLQPDTSNKYQFAILDANSQPIKNFDTVHEKKMHVIVVRKDLTDFQHIHPTLDQKTGVWTLDQLSLQNNGPYRIFADFTPSDAKADSTGTKTPVTIYEDILVGDQSKYQAQKIGDTTGNKTFGDYHVLLQTKPMVMSANTQTTLEYLFLDTKLVGNQAVTDLEPYLGAMGHAIVLSENLDFIHAHAMDDPALNKRGIVNFMFTPTKEGKYKVFAQFKRRGQVFTTDFVLPVYKDLAPGDVRLNSGADAGHGGH